MATTEIHAIKSTPAAAVSYIMADKIVKLDSDTPIWEDCVHEVFLAHDESGNEAKYVRYFTLTAFYQCDSKNPMNTYNELQRKFQNHLKKGGVGAKGGEPLLYHAHQSFKGREVDQITASQIGLELAKEVFGNHAVTVSVHTNGENIHCHLMVSAWDYNGRKWHNDHAAYRRLRETSDRLCEKFGLSVLQETKEQKLISYKDADGVTHYFEPTDRKIDIIKRRDAGEATTDDVNSYRNTEAYQIEQAMQSSNRDIVKRDIDALLPICNSFEELISRLRGMGYIIRDKKKNGQWLSHISYQPPTAEKATRDNKIGDGQFYLRESLERWFAEEKGEIEKLEPENGEHIPYFENYEYGTTDISSIDEGWRRTTRVGNSFARRTENEKKVIRDIKDADKEIRGLIDTESLRILIAEQKKRKGRTEKKSQRREEALVAQINDSFRCLHFMEAKEVFSYSQIMELYRATQNTFISIQAELGVAGGQIAQLREISAMPEKALHLREQIERGDIEYQLEERAEDVKLLEQMEKVIRRYGIQTPEGLEVFRNKVSGFERRAARLEHQMKNAAVSLAEIENCMDTLQRIDARHGRTESAFAEFAVLRSAREKRTVLVDETGYITAGTEGEISQQKSKERDR